MSHLNHFYFYQGHRWVTRILWWNSSTGQPGSEVEQTSLGGDTAWVEYNTAGILRLGGTQFSMYERVPRILIPIVRSGGSHGAVSVQYTTEDDTAIASVDYEAAFGTVSWADGEAGVKYIKLRGIYRLDSFVSSQFKVRLASPVGGGIEVDPAFDEATITILRDPGPGTLNLVSDLVEVEDIDTDPNTVTVWVDRVGGFKGEVTVDYHTEDINAVEGVDYLEATGTLTFPDGLGPQSITVTILGRPGDQGDRSFKIVIDNPQGTTIVGFDETEVVITDDAATILPPPPSAFPPVWIDDFLGYSEEYYMEPDQAIFMGGRCILVNLLDEEINGVLGYTDGSGLYGGSPDFMTGDSGFEQTPPGRVRAWVM
ncbi:MAG: Calx-beta domain-containing protein [Candidatus Polarisedimenticolia bacterium]